MANKEIAGALKRAKDLAGSSWESVSEDWALRFVGATHNVELDMRRSGTGGGMIMITKEDVGFLLELLTELKDFTEKAIAASNAKTVVRR